MKAGRTINRIRARWLRVWPRSIQSLEEQVRDELETHVAMAADYLVARGHSRDDAVREARDRFGDYDEALQRLMASARQREAAMARRERAFDMLQDVRLAGRLFRRSPGFYAGLAIVLAIGIGANAAVFSVLRATLLQPLPYSDPSRLVMLWRDFPNAARRPNAPAMSRGLMTGPMVLGWRREVSPEFGDIAALMSWEGNLEAQFDYVAGDRALRLRGGLVTPNFFSLLGVRATIGRAFAPSDSDGPPVVVLSHALWQREFGGDRAIVGQPIALTAGRGKSRARRTFVVAGVLPRDVHFTYPDETELWALMPWSAIREYNGRAIAFQAVMRIRRDRTLDDVRARSRDFRTGLEFPGQRAVDRSAIAPEPMHDWVVGAIRPSLELLGAVAGLLLLITCATAASALLARASARHQELAIRSAIGASRGRLVRQLFVEGAALAVCGTFLGVTLAAALLPTLERFVPSSIPRVGELAINLPLIAAAGLLAIVTVITAALAPAFGAVRRDPATQLSPSHVRASASSHAVRLRHGLVGLEAAIATALLVSAGFLLASFWRMGRVPLGFDGHNVVTVELRLLDPKYRDETMFARLQSDLLARARAIPGVDAVGLTSAVPFRGVDFLMVLGDQATGPKPANIRYVDPGYFAVLEIPLIRGRLLEATDRSDAPKVSVISESFARSVFGNADPIGRRIEEREVVGVVADIRYTGYDKSPGPAVYIPAAQAPSELFCLVLRTRVGLDAVVPALRRAVHEVDPTLPAMKFTTIDAILDASMANRRFYTVATAAFAAVALTLAVVGLVVVVSRVVIERRRELAIRTALGATFALVVRAAASRVIASIVAGVLVGVAGAFSASRLLEQFLFQVTPREPWIYAGVSGLMIGVALVAAFIPVRSLARVPLVSVLTSE